LFHFQTVVLSSKQGEMFVISVTAKVASLSLARLLGVHGDNLDSFCMHLWTVLVVEFKVDVAHDKGPDFITEAINVQPTLENETTFDFITEYLCHNAIKMLKHTNGNLWLDATVSDELVQRLDQSVADAACSVEFVVVLWGRGVVTHVEMSEL